MKRFIVALLLIGSAGLPALGQTPAVGLGVDHLPKNLRPPSSNRITSEEFLAKRPANRADVPADEDGPVPQGPIGKSYSLEDLSTFIRGEGTYAIVPRNAVIHLPKRHADRVLAAPEGRLQPWSEFINANRAWIQTHGVTLEEARGLKEFDEKTLEAFGKRDAVIVATLGGHPVSVNTRVKDDESGLAEPTEPLAPETKP